MSTLVLPMGETRIRKLRTPRTPPCSVSSYLAH